MPDLIVIHPDLIHFPLFRQSIRMPHPGNGVSKRLHPHTRKEWENFRPVLTDLYQVQAKKLSEVVEIPAEQGFCAE